MQVDTTTAAPPLQATCAECGYPFYPGADLCPSCGLADSTAPHYPFVPACLICGTKRDNSTGPCPSCGAPGKHWPTCDACGDPPSLTGDGADAYLLAPDCKAGRCLEQRARYASVAGCAPECAATHRLTRNGRGFDFHGCQRGGVVSGLRRRERTRERNAEWAALHREGLSMRQIAGLWGVAPSTVTRVLREPLKRPEKILEGTGGNAPLAYAHTRSDHVRAVQRRLNRLARARGLRCEPARLPAPPPLALAARCAPARPPWPPTSVTTAPPLARCANGSGASAGTTSPTETATPLGVARWQKKKTGRGDYLAGVVESVGKPRQIGFSTEVVAQPFRRL